MRLQFLAISHLLIPEENACAWPSFIGKKFKESKVDGFERRYPMQDLDMRKTSLVSVPRDFASSYSRGKCKMRLQMPSTAILHWKEIQREQSRWV
jgi:hypothetical protein